MLERILDVLVQRWRQLLIALVVVPAVAWGIGLALDHSPRLVLRVWADEPVLLVNGGTGGRPAATVASVLRELVGSDAFLEPILAAARPGFGSLTAGQQ